MSHFKEIPESSKNSNHYKYSYTPVLNKNLNAEQTLDMLKLKYLGNKVINQEANSVKLNNDIEEKDLNVEDEIKKVISKYTKNTLSNENETDDKIKGFNELGKANRGNKAKDRESREDIKINKEKLSNEDKKKEFNGTEELQTRIKELEEKVKLLSSIKSDTKDSNNSNKNSSNNGKETLESLAGKYTNKDSQNINYDKKIFTHDIETQKISLERSNNIELNKHLLKNRSIENFNLQSQELNKTNNVIVVDNSETKLKCNDITKKKAKLVKLQVSKVKKTVAKKTKSIPKNDKTGGSNIHSMSKNNTNEILNKLISDTCSVLFNYSEKKTIEALNLNKHYDLEGKPPIESNLDTALPSLYNDLDNKTLEFFQKYSLEEKDRTLKAQKTKKEDDNAHIFKESSFNKDISFKEAASTSSKKENKCELDHRNNDTLNSDTLCVEDGQTRSEMKKEKDNDKIEVKETQSSKSSRNRKHLKHIDISNLLKPRVLITGSIEDQTRKQGKSTS
eukprot:CAMPEP_0170521242 /NCGR_PEP_ID=MMETSP0209-20121228/6553_1 /TAXON_ID=665100 ORGANISM="Litonotus pictus, Strain P1" /NCGR_SAMPLE_ID=MMETSP0209 /ASSEMBLY_ACC=CAM_ASM_000301 /LENGTH=505 /DNA_ID=CAMNT_0010807971 /DNA_START=280 /DNA_END=1793 /DNA_ORIENTATION=-